MARPKAVAYLPGLPGGVAAPASYLGGFIEPGELPHWSGYVCANPANGFLVATWDTVLASTQWLVGLIDESGTIVWEEGLFDHFSMPAETGTHTYHLELYDYLGYNPSPYGGPPAAISGDLTVPPVGGSASGPAGVAIVVATVDTDMRTTPWNLLIADETDTVLAYTGYGTSLAAYVEAGTHTYRAVISTSTSNPVSPTPLAVSGTVTLPGGSDWTGSACTTGPPVVCITSLASATLGLCGPPAGDIYHPHVCLLGLTSAAGPGDPCMIFFGVNDTTLDTNECAEFTLTVTSDLSNSIYYLLLIDETDHIYYAIGSGTSVQRFLCPFANLTHTYRMALSTHPGSLDPDSVFSGGLTVTWSDAWISDDIGTVGTAGSTGIASGVFTIDAAGAGIGGTADAFRFVHRRFHGGGWGVVGRVVSASFADPTAQIGVLFRWGLDPGDPFCALIVTPAGDVRLLARTARGGAVGDTSIGTVALPIWLELDQQTDTPVAGKTTFAAYTSPTGGPWTLLATVEFDVSVPDPILLGYCVSSRHAGTTGIAVIDHSNFA